MPSTQGPKWWGGTIPRGAEFSSTSSLRGSASKASLDSGPQGPATPDMPGTRRHLTLGRLQGAQLSPAGDMLATLSEAALHIWHTNGSLHWVVPAGEVPWAGFAWSPEGDRIAILNYLGQLTLIKLDQLAAPAHIDYDHGGMGGVSATRPILHVPIQWSPHGSLLAVGCWDGVHIFNSTSGEHQGTLNDRTFEVRYLDWSADARRILSEGRNGTVLWDVATETALRTFDSVEDSSLRGLDWAAFSPDGSTIAIYHRTYSLQDKIPHPRPSIDIYDAATGALRRSFSLEEQEMIAPLGVAWSPKGDEMAIGTSEGRILLYNIDDDQITVDEQAHPQSIMSLSWVGPYIASASEDQTVRLWTVESAKPNLRLVQTFSGWSTAVKSVRWYPDGERLLVTCFGEGDAVRVLSSDGSEEFRIQPSTPGGWFDCADISQDGAMIATISMGRNASLWNAENGTFIASLAQAEPPPKPYRFAFIAVAILVAAIATTFLVLRRRRTRLAATVALAFLASIMLALPTAQNAVVAWSPLCRWSPRDPEILAVDRGQGIEIWNASDLDHCPMRILSRYPRCMAWSPDGKLIALGVLGKVEIWDVWAGEPIISMQTWQYVLSLAWAGDGRKLACLARYHRGAAYDSANPPAASCRSMADNAEVVAWEITYVSESPRLALNASPLGEAPIPRDLSTPDSCLSWSPSSASVAAGAGHQGYLGDSTRMAWAKGCGMVEPGVMVWHLDPSAGLMSASNMSSGHVRPVQCVDWSPDRRLIASGSDAGTVILWRVKES